MVSARYVVKVILRSFFDMCEAYFLFHSNAKQVFFRERARGFILFFGFCYKSIVT